MPAHASASVRIAEGGTRANKKAPGASPEASVVHEIVVRSYRNNDAIPPCIRPSPCLATGLPWSMAMAR